MHSTVIRDVESTTPSIQINRTLPPVNTKIYVVVNEKWIPSIRDTWVSSRDKDLEFRNRETNELFTVPASRVEWRY